jgi:hypothetical protein
MSTVAEVWKADPQEHDYPAAAAYLSLIASKRHVDRMVSELRSAESARGKAKDLLRASGLPLLGRDNPHVARDLEKIHQGVGLSPLLAIRGDLALALPLVIADGYHRLCASYLFDENVEVVYRIVDRAAG